MWQAQSSGRRPGGDARPAPGTAGGGFTDDTADLVDAARLEEQISTEPAVRELARQIAARLSLPRPPTTSGARRGRGTLASLPYRGAADDLDLDASLERIAEKPVPEEEDIVVRDRVRSPRAVVLAVDVSGSSRGERMTTVAATVGALAAELDRDRLAVIAFWSDAAIVKRLDDPVRPDRIVEDLLRVPARGLTNVAFPLQLAARELVGVHERDARVLLLSDCVHNAGPDPRPLAAALPRVDVLLETSGEKDVDLGKDIASAGHGLLRLARGARDVGPALSEMFRT